MSFEDPNKFVLVKYEKYFKQWSTKYNLSSYDTVSNTEMKRRNNYSSWIRNRNCPMNYMFQELNNNLPIISKNILLLTVGLIPVLDSKLVKIKDIDNVILNMLINNGWNLFR